jgi:metal-responsive CopG/Arc/MetJ family transcriptional regulator
VPLHKTAVTIPVDLLVQVDRAARQRGESRSRYVTRVLAAAVRARRDADITRRLNELFTADDVCDEQRRTAEELGRAGTDWDDERW